MSGLVILLSSQFYTYDFGPGDTFLSFSERARDEMESSIGSYFRIRFPVDWPADQQYDFEWQSIEHELDPFQEFDYSAI